jgi:hypothetical protein
MISGRELLPSDLGAVFDVRMTTWHDPNGAEKVLRFGITPDAVRELEGQDGTCVGSLRD